MSIRWSIHNTIEKLHLSRHKNKFVLASSILCIVINLLSWQDDRHSFHERTLFLRPTSSGTSANLEHFSPYETMIPPSQIDVDVRHRLAWNRSHDDADDPCRDILLTMPDEIRKSGQGAQLNHYLLSAVMAAYLDKALVVAENPKFEFEIGRPSNDLYDGGSQFGCPVDAFDDDGNSIKKDFPLGLSRLLRVPSWIGRNCPVPTCGGTMTYQDWRAARSSSADAVREIACVEADGRRRTVTVFSVDGRGPYLQLFRTEMVDRSTEASVRRAREWAMRLGASEDEARDFASLTSYQDIYDYIAARINVSGLIRFQPWIARDVERRIRSLQLPTDHEGGYASMHVRRGDKLIMEAAEDVRAFWRSKGYGEGEEVPSNYVPFSHYVDMAWGTCDDADENADARSPVFVYVATDDPETVHREVDLLPKASDGASVVNSCGDTAKFVFAPSSKDTKFHLKDGGTEDDCHSVYERNIAALADLFVLARSKKFVGDYNSNWGRIIRIFRLFLNHDSNTNAVSSKPMTVMKDMVVAWGHGHPEPGI
ncbi:hypothetical protein ACHAW6_007692 [Cyclotella cf. meneghiniana]